jgi:ABC-type uncharacterized transport system permease subunit
MEKTILPLIAISLYLVSGFLTGYRLFDKQEKKLPRFLPIALGYLALGAHGIILYQDTILAQGYNLGIFNAFSLVAFVISAVLLISALTKPVENLGIIIFPITACTIIFQVRFSGIHLLGSSASWGLKIHVLISLLAYSLLTIASVQAILLAILDKQLHDRKTGTFVRAMPPLQTMETLLFEMIGVGFALLTAALFSGFYYLEDMFMQHLAHKTVLSMLSWVFFAVLLWGRLKFGWRGKKAIRWTLGGFVTLMLAYFGSKAVLEILLK